MNEQNQYAYDVIADDFDAARTSFREKKYIDLLLEQLPAGARLLDLGCGTGKPIALYLAQAGYEVVGVDQSARMVELARRHVPAARFVQADMMSFTPEERFAAAIAWDAIFHIPRDQHKLLFQRVASWIRPEGLFLLSLGGSAWEGTSVMFGQTFAYSGFDPHQSHKLLEQAGFQIVLSELDDPSSKGHMVILAQKG